MCVWQGYEAVSIIITTNFHLLEMLIVDAIIIAIFIRAECAPLWEGGRLW